MSATMDPYGVLGLGPGASQAEIKRAYRRLAKALHPDAAGEAALPRFLELQDAYELLTGTKVRTIRAPGPASGSGHAPAGGTGSPGSPGGGAAEGFREPWRADPARARAAREQARARRPWTGGRSEWASSRPEWTANPGAGTARPAGPGGARDAGDRRSTASPGSEPPSGGPGTGTAGGQATGQPRPGGRRRASRKATLGSTSYDEAREPADRSWAGASWYGPTTGEYWIVNPREYADPRKHGPGYTSRGRGGQPIEGSDATQRWDATARPAADHAGETATETPAASRATAARRTTAAGPGATGSPDATARSGTTAVPAAASKPDAEQATAEQARVEDGIAGSADGRSALDQLLGALGAGPGQSQAWRRVGIALLAWPPLGLAAATAIGQATGCLSYSASCDSADRLLPWLAQAILVGLLLLSPWLARLLGVGTLAALVALVPGVGILTALGGASSAAGGPVLAGWLALAWLAGVGFAARRAVRGSVDSPIGSRGTG